jgi:hypothetical protein
MVLETVPLYVLFEASVLLAAFAEGRARTRERRSASDGTSPRSEESM